MPCIDTDQDLPQPGETVSDVDAGTLPTLVNPNPSVHVDNLAPLGQTFDDAESITTSSSSTNDPAIPNPYGLLLPSGTTDRDVEASTTSTPSVPTPATPHPFASAHDLLQVADIVEVSRVSTSSAHTRVIPNSSVGENIASSDHITSMEPAPAEISQLPSLSLSHSVGTPRNGSFSSRDGPFKFGETNIGLAFRDPLTTPVPNHCERTSLRPDEVHLPTSKFQGQNFNLQQVLPPNTNISLSMPRTCIDTDHDLLWPGETVGDLDADNSHNLVNLNPYIIIDLSPLDETVDDMEASTASSSTHDPAIPNSYGSSLPSGTTDNNADASTASTSSPQTFAITNLCESVHNFFRAADDVEASGASTSSACSRVIPISQVPSSSLPHHVQTTRNGIISRRDESFKLGEINIGLSFQAILALMLFHFQGSVSAGTPSVSFNLIGEPMAIGFTFSVIGIFLRNVCPRLATLGNYISLLSTTFGFFMMIKMLLPDFFSWTVWPACIFIFLAFVLALTRTR